MMRSSKNAFLKQNAKGDEAGYVATELIDRATRGAMVVVHCAVRHLVFENVFFHPAVCLLFDVNQFRRFHDALLSIWLYDSHYCARTSAFRNNAQCAFSIEEKAPGGNGCLSCRLGGGEGRLRVIEKGMPSSMTARPARG